VNRKPSFWIGRLLLSCLVSIGLVQSSAAQTVQKPAAKAATTKKVGAAPAAKKPAYSARRARTRRQRLAAARAAAAAREAAEFAVPRYKVDASGDLVPDIRAAAAIIYNPETGEVLWEENSQTQRSIASITKVMTALVFLEDNPDLSQRVTIASTDVYRASTTYLRAKDNVTIDDLLHLLLIPSDNAAARALARVSPHGSQGFIARMNAKAAELGLESTRYADPSGLFSENVSSAYDMARLIAHASGDERIGSIMRIPEYTVRTAKRTVTFRNTNQLMRQQDFDIRGSKTGFISKAGYCLATLLRLPQSGQQVAVVVLGARSSTGRFLETKNLFNWMSNKASTIFATKTAAVAVAAPPD
jgi:D-alanyl-D-alanine endopeptidase (penicillin-binding protein 7)